MKKNKIREHISCILYMIAFFGFLGAVTVENRGSMLDFSDLARTAMCVFSVICVIIAAIVWKAKDERGKKIKYGIMLAAIVIIVGGGAIDYFTTGGGAIEIITLKLPFEAAEVENIEMFHYDGVTVNGEKKVVTEAEDIETLYGKIHLLEVQDKKVEVFKEPPELTVVCGEEQITALKGTYSWEYSNGNGTSTGIEADSMQPLDAKEYMNELPLAYSYKSSVDSFKAHLQFETVPDEVEIRYWDASCWNDYSAESKELTAQALEADYVDGDFSTEYTAKLLEGNYIYEVIAKWSSSEDYGGTAHYSFYTVMGDYEPVSIQE